MSFDMNSISDSPIERAGSYDRVKTGISILICTHTPEDRIFRRTLKSVELLTMPLDVPVECIIIDNNSRQPVDRIDYVREFLASCPWASVIPETKQGLTFARICGFNHAKNSLILFVDDDNEVSSNYLETLIDLFDRYPSVAAWGPGNVNVDFLEGVSEWFSKNFNIFFQQKYSTHIEYGCIPETWAHFYPFGTGLAVRREILERYCHEVETGNLCSSDRQGNALSSGGDNQIVWEAIKMGYAAGNAPNLAINHLIPPSRSNLDYVTRLRFGTADSYVRCMVDSFPSLKAATLASTPGSWAIIWKIFGKIVLHTIKFDLGKLRFNLAGYIGHISSHYKVADRNNRVVDFMIQQLKIE
jgi:glycosyltransferase involved in cell wall biosynthesis